LGKARKQFCSWEGQNRKKEGAKGSAVGARQIKLKPAPHLHPLLAEALDSILGFEELPL